MHRRYPLLTMVLSTEELSRLVEKFQPITRYTIGEDQNHIIFHLQNEKEISISIKKNNENFETIGQLRNKNQRGFGEANSIMKGNSELDVAEKILENLVEFNVKRQNR